MTEKRARTPLSKVRIPFFERDYTPVKPTRMRARFRTVDEVVFEVSDASIVPSTYMNRLIYGSRMNKQQMSDITHPLPNVAADVFEKVMCYCYFHTSKYCDSLLPNQVKEWDDQFMALDPRQLCELASAAYYLDVKDLIELTCRAIAAIISGKSAEQIRKTFHIENDLARTIDRVLPASARRRGREHSPREGTRHTDPGDSVSQEQIQNDISQQNPGPQKTVDEIIEWIDSTSSKSQKKKKKKRRKDRNPAKKEGDNVGNDDRICDMDPSHTTSPDVEVETKREVTTEDHEPAHPANEISGCRTSIESNDIAEVSNQIQTLLESDNAHDGESSGSDIAIVSENIVNPRASLTRQGTTQNPETPRKSTVPEPLDCRRMQTPLISTSQDADAVERIQHKSPSEAQTVKQEDNLRHGKTSNGESADKTEIMTPQKKGANRSPQNIENGDIMLSGHGAPSRIHADEHRGGQTSRTQKDDVAMTAGPQTRALRSHQESEEPFIDCPENMDREVEDFQQRLSISEPLSSHRHTPHTESSDPLRPERSRKGIPCAKNADANGSWVVTQTIPKVSGSLRSTRSLENSQRTDVIPTIDASRSLPETEDRNEDNVRAQSPSIPKQVLAELLKINSEMEECKKIAAAIDEETARLGARREKVRDDMAFLIIQERQLREKYRLSDRFP